MDEKFEKQREQMRKKFSRLLSRVKRTKPGVYNIEVVEVLGVGQYWLGQPEVAVVKDKEGRIWEIPEDKNYGKPGNRLVSRWDVREGMKLKIVVAKVDGEDETTEIIVLKRGRRLSGRPT